MESPLENKVTILDKLLDLLERRFATATGAFIVGGLIVGLFMHFVVVKSKIDLIDYLKEDNEFWKNRYDESPDEQMRFYQMMEEVKNGKIDKIQIKDEYSKKLDEKTKQLDELEKK